MARTLSAEIGAWIESTVAKRDGKGFRKAWVGAGDKSAQGEPARLSVIARDGDKSSHVITLHVDTSEQRAFSRDALVLALAELDRVEAALAAPAPKAPAKPKAAPQRPQPTAPAQNTRVAPPAQTSKPAPAKVAMAEDDWLRLIRA